MSFLKMVYLTLATAFVMLAASLPSPAQQPDPVRCTGYPEPRTFLTSQSWWEQTEGKSGTDYGFVEEGTCFPVAQTLTGKVRFDVRVVMYESPGTLQTVQLYIFGKASGKLVARQSGLKKTCPTETCTYWFTFIADTAAYPNDGRQEFRFHSIVDEPGGKRMFASTGWQAYLKNGRPVAHYRKTDNFTEGRGWYTNEGYTTARLTSPVPKAPVSGIWTFSVKLAPGSGGKPVKEYYVVLDPCYTCIPEQDGITIKEGDGQYEGSVSIDTTRLTNGPHTVLLRAEAPSTTGSSLSGVQIIPFVVKN